MKVVVTTTYENLDKKTVDKMVEMLEAEGWPKDQIDQINSVDIGRLKSKDPNSEQTATTVFLVDRFAK